MSITTTEVGSRAFWSTPELADKYAAGGWAALIGRNSTASGQKGREQAIKDLRRAAEGLARKGLDVRPYLPDNAELDGRLTTAPVERSVDENGHPFTNRFVEIYITQLRVVVLLSIGTARKLDDGGVQPFVNRLERIVRRQKIVLVYSKRLDRLTRNAWALGPVALALGDNYLGDNDHDIRRVSGVESILIFFSAQQGEMEAETLAVKSREGRVDATGTQMVDGVVAIGVAQTPPAGFGRVRLRADNGGSGRCILYLDDERWRPDRSTVAYGLAEALDGTTPPSQVENVRFALTHLGLPGWGGSEVAHALTQRGYSTIAYRSMHGASSCFPPGRRADVVLQSILANLDVYESGRLTLAVDSFLGLSVVIEGCFPTDGPWATAKDFERIRRYRAQGGMRFDGRILLVLAGLRMEVNRTAASFVTADRKPRSKPPVSYRIQMETEIGRKCPMTGVPNIDAFALSKAIAGALIAAADKAYPLVPIAVEPTDHQWDLMRLRTEQEAELAHLRERALDLKERVLGDSRLAGSALLAELARDYDTLVTQGIPSLEGDLLSLESAITDEDKRNRMSREDLQAAGLARLLASLNDPLDTTYSRLLKNALIEPRLTIVQRPGGGYSVSFEARIKMGSDLGSIEIPLEACWSQGVSPAPGVEEVLSALAAGTPFRDVSIGAAPSLLDEIAQHLERDRKDCFFLNVTDPRILRVGMATTLYRLERCDEQIAADLGESVELVRRVGQLWATSRKSAHWLRTSPSSVFGRIHVAAAALGGTVSDAELQAIGISKASARSALENFTDMIRVGRGWHLTQCHWCGSSTRGVSRLHEVDTSICLSCRRDRAGVEWPSEPYDGYLMNLDDLVTHDLVPPRQAIATAPARWKGKKTVPEVAGCRHEETGINADPLS
ncbi:MAG TPA: hypothetical protein VMV96_04040 [Acidimicrobiales bacterium]|nr:hypothetical protein [Acidimicrobiales bacterium]